MIKPCDKDNFVVDVGANIGFFSAFSLSMGCNTAIFEPQVLPASAITATLCINHNSYKKAGIMAQLVKLPVSKEKHVRFPIKNSLHQHNTGGAGSADCNDIKNTNCIEMNTVNLDSFIFGTSDNENNNSNNSSRIIPGSNIRVLKIDSEGYESDVLATMTDILKKQTAENILFEMIPHIMGLEKNINAVTKIFNAGYHVAECPFSFLEGVRKVDKPFIKQVVPLTLDSAIVLITSKCIRILTT
jgi:FkbM family methyltransferase